MLGKVTHRTLANGTRSGVNTDGNPDAAITVNIETNDCMTPTREAETALPMQ